MIAKKREVHGGSRTRLYVIWADMKGRCRRKTDTSYSHYGGRGISICDEWHDSFSAFRLWAMSSGYSDSLTIDRIDVNGNYEPSNCRWATKAQQSVNKRKKTSKATSRFKGVSWHKGTGRWQARLRIAKALHHLGCFENEEEAAIAYDTAAKAAFGEYANLNFKDRPQ